MFLTKHQKNVLEQQGHGKRSRKVIASQAKTLTGKPLTPRHMHTNNTAVFNNIKEALDVFIEYYPIFERRAVKDADTIKTKLNTLNRRISKSVKERVR